MMKQADTVVTLKRIDAGFRSVHGNITILEKLEGSVRCGEMVSLIGENGSGKSTLLKTMIGLHDHLSGELEIFGRNIGQYNRMQLAKMTGYVAAGSPVPNNMSVEELVTLGRFPHTNWIGKLQRADNIIIAESIESVGISHLRNRNLYQLSDGEKQRAMIARSLAQDTALLVLDEPTAFLDLPNKYELIRLLRRLAAERDKAVVLSTHDLNIAVRESDKIWLLHDKKMSEGAPEDLLLSGEFARMFARSKLEFIEEEGTFRNRSETSLLVQLDSHKKLRGLTVRALQRYETAVTEKDSLYHIKAYYEGESPLWKYSGPEGEYRFLSIYELAQFLKRTVRTAK